jgi:phytoene dehydrogenase-like protein
MDLRALGYDSGNYWWYRNRHVGDQYRRMERRMPEGPIDALFVSVSSLKDPSARRDGHHTLEMFTFLPYAPFAKWRDTPPEARPAAYHALNARLTERMLDACEEVIPGARRHMRFCELGTPLTNDYFCATRAGVRSRSPPGRPSTDSTSAARAP